MKRSSVVTVAFTAAFTGLAASAFQAGAATLPAIMTSAKNAVPECVTPGRLMALIAQRNPKLDRRFGDIATIYMRLGEQMGMRWDYAFYQMMLETGSLSYTRDGKKPGDVKPRQNNFAGLGATGKGAPGETFASIEDGVKAHLQHLLMYSGERVEAPVAERTRKVQEWGVLTSWQKKFGRPITFSDLASKWAPGSRGYARDVQSISNDFQESLCGKPDPRPELVKEARADRAAAIRTAPPGEKADTTIRASKTSERLDKLDRQDKPDGRELARQANERARAEGGGSRSALGARAIVAAKPYAGEAATGPGVTILNDGPKEASTDTPAVAAEAVGSTPATVQTASAASAARQSAGKHVAAGAATVAALPKASPPVADTNPPAATPAKCRVYTASYGGQKSVIIRASADQYTNFTVLDVNDGQEAREIEAYVSAYAKGGQKVGEFSSSNAALDKAFELCPEG